VVLAVSKITMTLELLGDGKWHEIEELLRSLQLSEQKFWQVTAFLGKYGFVKVDEKNRRVRINRDFQRVLAQAVT